MEPLDPNPGGTIDPDDLVGRTAELQRLIEAVSRSGAHVTGERRMGKTSLLVKLQSELEAAGRTVLRISAETSDLDVFAKRLLRELRANELVRERITAWEKEVEGTLSVAVGQTGIKLTGKATRASDDPPELDVIDLLASLDETHGCVLVIDEVTVLCHGLGPEAAVELLRALRAERQGRHPLPLVLSGSIGLHHAIPDTQAINDLWTIEVGPMADEESRELIERLLLGVGAERSDEVVGQIAAATSNIPFYIQAVVDRMRSQPDIAVDDLVERCIAEDAWHTKHYVTRITDYYGTDSADTVRAVLDQLALAHPDGLTVEELTGRLSAATGILLGRDATLDLLDRLEKDHYLTRSGLTDAMSSALLARVWRLHRRLS